jgi:hypothetical protein
MMVACPPWRPSMAAGMPYQPMTEKSSIGSMEGASKK